jgi:hypothetical protein
MEVMVQQPLQADMQISFAANSSSMGIPQVELLEKGDGTQDLLTPELHDEVAMSCLGQFLG